MLPVLLVVCFILVADRVTKSFVASRLATGRPLFRRVQTRFRRRGLIQNAALLLLWFVALAGIVLAAGSGRFFQSTAAQAGLGAALAGSASNLYDRLRRSAVIDFIDLGWWPVFNIADVAIAVGVLVAVSCARKPPG